MLLACSLTVCKDLSEADRYNHPTTDPSTGQTTALVAQNHNEVVLEDLQRAWSVSAGLHCCQLSCLQGITAPTFRQNLVSELGMTGCRHGGTSLRMHWGLSLGPLFTEVIQNPRDKRVDWNMQKRHKSNNLWITLIQNIHRAVLWHNSFLDNSTYLACTGKLHTLHAKNGSFRGGNDSRPQNASEIPQIEENTYSSAYVHMHTSRSPITFQSDTTNE